MTARFIVADVFDGLATLETGSVDLVVTSPPFLALRSYLPADHADKGKEIGSESTPAEWIDTMLRVTQELRRVLAPHGSICIELGDTYAGSTGFHRVDPNYVRRDFPGWNLRRVAPGAGDIGDANRDRIGEGWPLAKSRTLTPSLYQIALAYGFNPLTGSESPAGQWRIRNVVTWARPNPPVGALGDKWRPATSDLIVACTSSKRYWDDLATRQPWQDPTDVNRTSGAYHAQPEGGYNVNGRVRLDSKGGAPLLDYWVIPPGGYTGAHYAVFPEELVVPCVKAMCPPKVCRTCGEPSRRIVERGELIATSDARMTAWDRGKLDDGGGGDGMAAHLRRDGFVPNHIRPVTAEHWSDCGHDNWRPGLVLDPFAGSGTTLAVATGHGHDAIGIDLDSRNAELARDRVGPFLFEMVDLPVPTP